MLNTRDAKIIRHIESYGFVTISECYKMFFNNRNYGYDLARKRLSKLQEQGYIFSHMDYLERCPEKIFYIDENFSTPKKHTIIVMNAFAEMVRLGAEPLFFKREQKWLDGKRRSDGYFLFKIDSYIFQLFIEVESATTNKKTSREIIVEDFNKKYTEIFSSDEPYKLIRNILRLSANETVNPVNRILVIDDVTHTIPWYVDGVTLLQSDLSLNKISQILI